MGKVQVTDSWRAPEAKHRYLVQYLKFRNSPGISHIPLGRKELNNDA
jgi:hypothetical protein